MLAKALAPVAAAARLAAPLASPGETAPATKEVHRTVALDRDGRLSVEAYKGSIQIAAWDKAEAEVTARIEAESNCGDAGYQAEMVRDTDVVISGGGASVSVRSDYDRVRDRSVWHFFSSCSSLPYVRYTISMPRAAR